MSRWNDGRALPAVDPEQAPRATKKTELPRGEKPAPLPIYDQVLKDVLSDPEAVIRERRVDQVMSLKLMLPDIIRSQKRMRRVEWEKFETCKKAQEEILATITLAVKQAREGDGKLTYPNRETREVEIQERLKTDPKFIQYDRMRRLMYAQTKDYDDEIEFLRSMDDSLLEILACFTALLASPNSLDSQQAVRAARRVNRRQGTRLNPHDERVLP